jgi:hypothetical protein
MAREGHENRTDLYGKAKEQHQMDKDHPGMKKFMVHDPSGGVNHFFSSNTTEALGRIKDSVAGVGKAGRYGYTAHVESPEHWGHGIQVGGGVMHAVDPHPAEGTKAMKIHHEDRPMFNPRLPF